LHRYAFYFFCAGVVEPTDSAMIRILFLIVDNMGPTANFINASQIGSPLNLSITVINRYVFSPIFTGLVVCEYSNMEWLEDCAIVALP
jgi:hypothetical protein